MTTAKADESLPDMGFMKSGNTVVMLEGLNKNFSPGTPRTFVEKLLVDVAGAEKIRSHNRVKIYSGYVDFDFDIEQYKETVTYGYKRPFLYRLLHLFLTDGSYTIGVSYDKQDRVIGYISISGPTGL